MSDAQQLPSDNDIDDELKSALLAAFGDDADDLLDDDEDGEIPAELLAKFGAAEQSELPETFEQDFDELIDEDDDSPRTRWIKKLSRAIYANQFSEDESQAKLRSNRFVVFGVGDQQFGLPLSGVREIARYPRVTELPRTPSWLRGVANFRGQIISVTDLRNLLHVSSQRPASGEKVIIVHSQQYAANTAIVVDRVLGIRSLEDEPGDVADLSHRVALIANGIAKIEQLTTVLIDPDQLFGCAELMALTT